MAETNNGKPAAKQELRRDVTVWGSFMWGYADVGADVYVALGLVVAAAQGVANIAFATAGLVYILIGLCYTELASAYPVAGGGQYFTLRGLGDFWGFLAGAALLLDYTIDIALFAYASAGYVNFFFPAIKNFAITIGPFANINPIWAGEALLIIFLLILLNIRGVRESSLLNEVLGILDLITESSIIIFGFLFAFRPEIMSDHWMQAFKHWDWNRFMYGSSLAIISYVGLESISQAAQETRRPATIIPRSSVALIFTVFIFATAFSTLALGIPGAMEAITANIGDPVATLAGKIPFIGMIAGPFAAIIGATILLISSNTGVMGASRVTYSMSELGLIPKWFDKVHPRFQTPVRTIVVFSMLAVIQVVLSALTPHAMDTLGNMYAFGATLGYTLVFISLVTLRFKDPYTPRPYKMPLNVKVPYHGRKVEFPILGVIGLIGVSLILFEVILTHPIGRIAGPAWCGFCLILYFIYRRRTGRPLLGNVRRNWEAKQIEVLTGAEEFDLLENYKLALLERDRRKGRGDRNRSGPRPPAPPDTDPRERQTTDRP
jgi:APA family basic amino acid/polyamine antiporter